MHSTSLKIPEAVYRKANVAAASQGLSTSELIRCALDAALVTIAENDTAVAAAFRVYDSDAEPVS